MSATRRYASAAVENLRSYLSSNLATMIGTISTEEAFATALATPDVYRGAITPFPEESLAVEVDCDGDDPEDLHNNYWYIDCFVRVFWRMPDSNLELGQQKMRAYASAVKRQLMTDPSLGNLVVDAVIGRTEYPPVADGGDGLLINEFRTAVRVEIQET